MDYIYRFDRADLRDFLAHHPQPGQRQHPVVEAGNHHFLRDTGRRHHPRTGEGIHLNRVTPCAGSCDLGAGRRRVAGDSFGLRRR